MIDVIMPKMGESITEGTILEWKKKIGDLIELDEPLLEISTDKVDSEIPSPAAGTISELLFGINEVIQVGTVIARISIDGDIAAVDTKVESSSKLNNEEAPAVSMEISTASETKPQKTTMSDSERYISPLVRSIMSEEGIAPAELKFISGSGHQSRITKKDILTYLENRSKSDLSSESVSSQLQEVISLSPSTGDHYKKTSGQPEASLRDHRYPMDRIRKKIADHMIASQQTSAHVYSTSEADVSNLVDLRLSHKDRFKEKYGINLTYTPMIMFATIKAIQEFPMMNSSIMESDIVSHQNINMGLAVALPDNNLIVPVVQRCEEMNFLGMARQSAILAEKARTGKLVPDEIFGSTFTITNPGVFGGLFGMAIINQPNVGILSVGTFQKRPVVKESEFGDTIAIRSMVYLTLSYDHRIIDGAYGTKFLSRVCELLEAFDESIIV